MAQEKIIYSRQQQKHDIEANWIKAVNFIPKEGEIIVYDAETAATDLTGTDRTTPITYPRIKIGDGVKTVALLPFIKGENEVYIGAEEMPEGYTLWINPEDDALDLTDYATKEEVEQLVANNKAIIVTSNSNIASMSSQEIVEAVQNGYTIYLEAFKNKYVVPQYIETGKITFEYPVTTSVEAPDGNTYSALIQRSVAIRNNSVAFANIILPSQNYVDAQIGSIETVLDTIITIQTDLFGGAEA